MKLGVTKGVQRSAVPLCERSDQRERERERERETAVDSFIHDLTLPPSISLELVFAFFLSLLYSLPSLLYLLLPSSSFFLSLTAQHTHTSLTSSFSLFSSLLSCTASV